MNSNKTAVEGSMDKYTTLWIFSTNICILASEICGNLGEPILEKIIDIDKENSDLYQ